MKIDLYRRLTRVIDRNELKDLQAEMTDRFGPLPPPVQRLAAFAELRIAAARWSIESIVREEGYIAMPFVDLAKITALNKANRGRLRIVENRTAYLPLPGAIDDSDADKLLALMQSILNAG